MAFFDLTLEELKKYRPERTEAADFDEFWQQTLTETRQHPLDARFELVDVGLQTLESYDVTFNGYGGQPIKGWLILPRTRTGLLACVVEYIGYGGGRGFPTDWLTWASCGFAHLIMDTRGQGSGFLGGATPDPEPPDTNPHFPGFMTRGILKPHAYYYRRVFSDAVRAVEAALAHPAIDPQRLAVTGGSQGGGIAIAATALEPRIQVTMPDVPFLCHYRRATQLTTAMPYEELAMYCKINRDKIETVFKTLSYFDGVNFSSRIAAQAFFSVALMDEVCPPSTIFAAYNYLTGPKTIKVWEYNHHEGGGNYQQLEKIKFLRELWSLDRL